MDQFFPGRFLSGALLLSRIPATMCGFPEGHTAAVVQIPAAAAVPDFPALRGMRDGEMRMQAAACAVVISFRTGPGHTHQHSGLLQPGVPRRSEFGRAGEMRFA